MHANEMADRLLERYGTADRAAPVWLKVRARADGAVESRVLPEPDGWMGRRLPSGWDGVAVVATGRLSPLDPGHEMPASLAPGRAGGLRLACVVLRAGAIGWRMLLPDGSTFDEPPGEGLILDMLRRAVGRSTSEPRTAAGELISLLWIDAALDAVGAGPGRRIGWLELIDLHPLVRLEGVDADRAEKVLGEIAAEITWEGLQALAIRGPEGVLFPAPQMACWMDAGMFSRWVMSHLEDIDTALRRARKVLSPDAYHRLRRITPRPPVEGRTYVRYDD